MENFKNYFIVVILSIILFLTLSCEKDCPECPVIDLAGANICISMLDSDTHESVFFGANAIYNPDSVFVTGNNLDSVPISQLNGLYEDSLTICFNGFFGNKSIFIDYLDGDIDTLAVENFYYEPKTDQCQCFTPLHYDVSFNGKKVCTDCQSKILNIYK